LVPKDRKVETPGKELRLNSHASSCVSITLLLIASARRWSWRGQGTFARIFSISEAVKARIVCVRMLPSMSAASNTLAAVSSSGASKMQT